SFQRIFKLPTLLLFRMVSSFCQFVRCGFPPSVDQSEPMTTAHAAIRATIVANIFIAASSVFEFARLYLHTRCALPNERKIGHKKAQKTQKKVRNRCVDTFRASLWPVLVFRLSQVMNKDTRFVFDPTGLDSGITTGLFLPGGRSMRSEF